MGLQWQLRQNMLPIFCCHSHICDKSMYCVLLSISTYMLNAHIFLNHFPCYGLQMTMTNEIDTESPAVSDRDLVVDAISVTMARMRVMMGRRFMSRLALSRLDESHSLELSHFDVVKTVAYIARDQEVTVGAIAEHLRIDPSRASRVVADLVRRGTLRREASQFDARRTIVTLTEAGEQLQHHFDLVRREVIGQILEDWSEEDVHQFQSLFDRFISSLECRTQGRRGEIGQ